MEKAGFVPRLISTFIDGIVMSIVFGIASAVGGMMGDSGTIIALLLMLVVAFGYYPYFWASSGQTPGKKIMGIKVVKKEGGLVSFGGGILRMVGYLVDSIVFGLPIGFLWAFFDKDQQCWHDKMAGTIVVKA
jgi:uncharacterized RDD family membrane protein YckC